MKTTRLIRCLKKAALALTAVALSAGPSFAYDVTLSAQVFQKTMPDGVVVDMWGFADCTSGTCGPASSPGPVITVPVGDPILNITLINNLPGVATSLVIPGQPSTEQPVKVTDAQGRARIQSFAHETAPGATSTYSWTNVKPGTFIYQSGTHPALQIQMGLYGALKKDFAAGQAYGSAGSAYQNEVILFYSEVASSLHAPPAAANPTSYEPRYYLINGEPYPNAAAIQAQPITAGQNVLIRFLSMALDNHVPTLLGGEYMSLIAEDGNLYPYPKRQYSVLLPAGKAIDAVWTPSADGTVPIYDRRLFLTNNDANALAATAPLQTGGMLVRLTVGAATGLAAANDSYSVAEDTALAVPAPGVLGNDTGTGITAQLVSGPSAASAFALNPDGSFNYTPNANYSGGDIFTYRAVLGSQQSNTATVTIAVTPANDPPVAVADSYTATSGQALNVAAPGVLGNDTDPDGDALTAQLVSPPASGTLTLNANGSFSFTPPSVTAPTPVTFTYAAFDGTVASAPATVTITVNPAVNRPPVANNDTATTTRNTPVVINVVNNDTDPDGTINPATVVIVSNPTRGGTAVSNGNGTITFTPRRNFLGTDTFTYNVRDNAGALSNTATVRVNVVR